MLKREVLRAWENRATETQTRIDEEIEPELERRQYELEIAQRLLEKAQDDASRETWQIQVDVLQMMIGMVEGDLAGHLLMHGNHTLTYCCTAPWRRVTCITSRAMESSLARAQNLPAYPTQPLVSTKSLTQQFLPVAAASLCGKDSDRG